MKRTWPERKPARIRKVEPERILHTGIKVRLPTEDVDDYIFGYAHEKKISER